MSPDAIKFRFSDYFWPFGVSLVCGCAGLYGATLALFSVGISLTPWHGMAFLSAAFTGSLFGLGGDFHRRVKQALAVLMFQLLLCGTLAGVASRYDDLTYDGMNVRIEPVINLMAGWNPVLDPDFVERENLARAHPFLSGGHNHQPTSGAVLAGYFANLTGEVNAGKAVTPILALAAFGIAFGALISIGVDRGWAVALAALAALNPVGIYQSSSFYVDGHISAYFAIALFAGLCAIQASRINLETAVFFLGLLLLAGGKISGFFYGLLLFLLFFLLWTARFYRHLRILTVGAALFLVGAGILFIAKERGGFGGVSTFAKDYIHKGVDFVDGAKGYKAWAPGLGRGENPGRLRVFFNAHFSPTAAMADEPVQLKFPFWFNRRELAVFEDLSPQPIVGGFGPLYGAYFVLSALSLLMIRKKPPMVSWVPLIASFGSIYFSQIWWARWTPQAWLIPLGFLLPVICALHGEPPGKKWVLPFLATFTGLLNSILILAFYTSGCLKAQAILQSQLSYLHTLPQPLLVHMPLQTNMALRINEPLFRSNRIWFIRENLDFVLTEDPPPRPRMKLYRTGTQVGLPQGSDPARQLEPQVWRRWAPWKLVEL